MSLLPPSARAWTIVLLAAGCAANGFLSCGASTIAFAAVAATSLSLRAALVVALGVWAEGQALGFCVLRYPHDPQTLGFGVLMGAATVCAVFAARALRGAHRAVSFVAAFGAYELVFALVAAGTGTAAAGFTLDVLREIFVDNALVAIGLSVLQPIAGGLESLIAVAAGLAARSRR